MATKLDLASSRKIEKDKAASLPAIPDEAVSEIRPQVTIFDGKIVFVHPQFVVKRVINGPKCYSHNIKLGIA